MCTLYKVFSWLQLSYFVNSGSSECNLLREINILKGGHFDVWIWQIFRIILLPSMNLFRELTWAIRAGAASRLTCKTRSDCPREETSRKWKLFLKSNHRHFGGNSNTLLVKVKLLILFKPVTLSNCTMYVYAHASIQDEKRNQRNVGGVKILL